MKGPTWPFWIAHRGAGKQAPENTLAAFREGLRHGFCAFECDVQLSQDGVPFLLHDERLERTSSGSGLGSQAGWLALSQLDAGAWHSPAFAGEPIMSLAALAAWAQAHQLHINLELKPSSGQAQRVGAGVCDWLRAHWRAPLPLLSSFEPQALEAASGYPLALLCEAWSPQVPDLALHLGAQTVVCEHTSLTAQAIETLHGAGLRAMAYTVNTLAQAQRLHSAGIDGLITDALDLPKALRG
jgi:glycerophosphoryl diester phosphodiesterase